MKFIQVLIILCTLNIHAQLNVKIIATRFDGGPVSEMGEELNNMYRNISVGNGCGDDNFMEVPVYDDLNMNGHTLQLLNSKVVIYDGELLNIGVIEFLCDVAIIEYKESETLSVP
jgi:hypothetical protein